MMLKNNKKNYLLAFLLVVFLLSSALIYRSWASFAALRTNYLSGKNYLYLSQDSKVLGISTEDETVTINFKKLTNQGSPLVFGGSQKIEHQEGWDKIAAVGVTSFRHELNVEAQVKPTITLLQYTNNENNVQDPANWDQRFIQKQINLYTNAKERGLTTIGIMSYAPAWLTQNKNRNGVPVNWDVYRDVIKKVYKIHHKHLDYIEIWNEPTYDRFLDVNGTGLTKEEAYLLIARNAIQAIEEASQELGEEKPVPFGGPVSHTWQNQQITKKILEDSYIGPRLSFLSYHYYGNVSTSTDLNQKNINTSNLPVFITEWNQSSEEKAPSKFNTGADAIAFTASQLINFLNQGIAGANYFMLEAVYPENISPKPNRTEGFFGFYKWDGRSASLLPQASVWELLSNTMGLGKGTSQIFFSLPETNETHTLAYKNNNNQYGLAVVNTSSTDKNYILHFDELPYTDNVKFSVFIASTESDGKHQQSDMITSSSSAEELRLFVPAKSVIGINIEGSNRFDRETWNLLRRLYLL